MAIKMQDILKDARTLTVSGLALVAVWAILLPTYRATVEGQRAVKHLAAFLQLKQLLGENRGMLQFRRSLENGDSGQELPMMAPGSISWTTNRDNALMRCSRRIHQEANARMFSERKDAYCEPLMASLLDHQATTVELVFKSIPVEVSEDMDEDMDVLAYFDIKSKTVALPFDDYRVIFRWRGDKKSGAFVAAERAEKPSTGDQADDQTERNCPDYYSSDINIDDRILAQCYDAFIVRASVVDTREMDAGNSKIGAALNILEGGYAGDKRGREPRYWGASQGLLASEMGRLPEIDDLRFSDPGVLKLIKQYIRDEGVSDIAGVKVPITLAPWTILLVLSMITCLLYGSLASLRRVSQEELGEDFGWLLLQSKDVHGIFSAKLAVVLLMITTGVLGWVIFATSNTALAIKGDAAIPLAIVALSIAAFSFVSLLLGIQQRKLANMREHTNSSREADPDLTG